MRISARIERVTHSPRLHVATAGAFVAVNAVGYVLGGGLFSPTTARLLRIGVRLALIPIIKRQREVKGGTE